MSSSAAQGQDSSFDGLPAPQQSVTSPQAMREFYAQPFTEPDGSRTWCVREYRYEPDLFSRQIVSWHPTREEAQEEVDRRYGR